MRGCLGRLVSAASQPFRSATDEKCGLRLLGGENVHKTIKFRSAVSYCRGGLWRYLGQGVCFAYPSKPLVQISECQKTSLFVLTHRHESSNVFPVLGRFV